MVDNLSQNLLFWLKLQSFFVWKHPPFGNIFECGKNYQDWKNFFSSLSSRLKCDKTKMCDEHFFTLINALPHESSFKLTFNKKKNRIFTKTDFHLTSNFIFKRHCDCDPGYHETWKINAAWNFLKYSETCPSRALPHTRHFFFTDHFQKRICEEIQKGIKIFKPVPIFFLPENKFLF